MEVYISFTNLWFLLIVAIVLVKLGVCDFGQEIMFKGTSHDSVFQFSLFSTLADIFAV